MLPLGGTELRLADDDAVAAAAAASISRFCARVSSIFRSSDGDGVPVDGVFDDDADDVDGRS